MSFYYLWSNPKDKYAVVDVHGYAIFNGTANVGSGGGLFPGSRSASARVTGSLGILEWWNQPPTSPLPQPDQSVVVLDLYVRTDGFGEVGALDFRSIFRGYDLSRTRTLVPPFGTVVLLVTAGVSCQTGEDSGLAEVDFASGAFNVGSPAVLVTVLS